MATLTLPKFLLAIILLGSLPAVSAHKNVYRIEVTKNKSAHTQTKTRKKPPKGLRKLVTKVKKHQLCTSQSNSPIVVTNEDGLVVWCNPSAKRDFNLQVPLSPLPKSAGSPTFEESFTVSTGNRLTRSRSKHRLLRKLWAPTEEKLSPFQRTHDLTRQDSDEELKKIDLRLLYLSRALKTHTVIPQWLTVVMSDIVKSTAFAKQIQAKNSPSTGDTIVAGANKRWEELIQEAAAQLPFTFVVKFEGDKVVSIVCSDWLKHLKPQHSTICLNEELGKLQKLNKLLECDLLNFAPTKDGHRLKGQAFLGFLLTLINHESIHRVNQEESHTLMLRSGTSTSASATLLRNRNGYMLDPQGDRANTSARLEQSATDGFIQISATDYAKLPKRFQMLFEEKRIFVKDISDNLRVYRIRNTFRMSSHQWRAYSQYMRHRIEGLYNTIEFGPDVIFRLHHDSTPHQWSPTLRYTGGFEAEDLLEHVEQGNLQIEHEDAENILEALVYYLEALESPQELEVQDTYIPGEIIRLIRDRQINFDNDTLGDLGFALRIRMSVASAAIEEHSQESSLDTSSIVSTIMSNSTGSSQESTPVQLFETEGAHLPGMVHGFKGSPF